MWGLAGRLPTCGRLPISQSPARPLGDLSALARISRSPASRRNNSCPLSHLPFPLSTAPTYTVYSWPSMATEKQIQANRANAAKSTGPRTPEGKRISSQNAAIYARTPVALIPKGKSLRRFKELVAALRFEFQPRDPAEDTLVQAMAVARWRLTRMWGITTATLQKEMKRLSTGSIPAGSGALLAANAFRSLARKSRLLAQHRMEAKMRPPIQLRPRHTVGTTRNRTFKRRHRNGPRRFKMPTQF